MRPSNSLLTGAAALLAAAPALAHDGHPHGGLLAGLMHPLGGIDHLLATVGIGLVAGLVAHRASLQPAADGASVRGPAGAIGRGGVAAALGLVAGAAWTALGVPLPAIPGGVAELGVASGLLALAFALLAADRIGVRGLAAFALAIAVPHGLLHAAEGSGAAFFTGLAIAGVGLFAVGVAAGRALAARPQRTAGRARWALAAGYLGGFVWFVAAALR